MLPKVQRSNVSLIVLVISGTRIQCRRSRIVHLPDTKRDFAHPTLYRQMLRHTSEEWDRETP
jgi:hypothetical protein